MAKQNNFDLPILLPLITVGISVGVYWETFVVLVPVQSKAQRLLPHTLHESFHQPLSLCSSEMYVLLLVDAFCL